LLTEQVRRLKTWEQYQAVLANAPMIKTAHFAMHRAGAALLTEHPEVWVGAMVPKRWAKRAVTRNLIKRQIYNMAQQYETRLTPLAHLVRMRAGFGAGEFKSAASEQLKQTVRTEMEDLFNLAYRASPGAIEE
jgi:ribonuclease P protein component